MLRRLARRLLHPTPPASPPSASPTSQPPPRTTASLNPARALPAATPPGPHPLAPGGPDPRDRAHPVALVDVPELLAGTAPRGAPILVHHWASWDDLSTAGLPALVALVRDTGVDAVGVAWDEFADPPLGRIAPMAQRPARWAGGEQAEAWARQAGIGWPILVFGADPDALFGALHLVDRWVPQVTLYAADGGVLAHHHGPSLGPEWEAFRASVAMVQR